MAGVIYKYKIEPGDLGVDIPNNGRILYFGYQDPHVYCWVVCDIQDATYEMRSRRIRIYGTGDPMTESWMSAMRAVRCYVNSFFMPADTEKQRELFPNGLVFHAFDCGWSDEDIRPIPV